MGPNKYRIFTSNTLALMIFIHRLVPTRFKKNYKTGNTDMLEFFRFHWQKQFGPF